MMRGSIVTDVRSVEEAQSVPLRMRELRSERGKCEVEKSGLSEFRRKLSSEEEASDVGSFDYRPCPLMTLLNCGSSCYGAT